MIRQNGGEGDLPAVFVFSGMSISPETAALLHPWTGDFQMAV
jgi:hypothetical protein